MVCETARQLRHAQKGPRREFIGLEFLEGNAARQARTN
jgi:hypothetical protein